MDKNKIKKQSQDRRHKRVRSKVSGIASKPRLCVFRSLNHIYVQAIDDLAGKTLAASSDLELAQNKIKPELKVELKGKEAEAYQAGSLIAKKLLEQKIEIAVFDKASYKYHGRVKALAQGARDAGLKF
ncbi:MAG: 50S ribosomal protein L18 [Patescibacteria group bacterium]